MCKQMWQWPWCPCSHEQLLDREWLKLCLWRLDSRRTYYKIQSWLDKNKNQWPTPKQAEFRTNGAGSFLVLYRVRNNWCQMENPVELHCFKCHKEPYWYCSKGNFVVTKIYDKFKGKESKSQKTSQQWLPGCSGTREREWEVEKCKSVVQHMGYVLISSQTHATLKWEADACTNVLKWFSIDFFYKHLRKFNQLKVWAFIFKLFVMPSATRFCCKNTMPKPTD